ncbi:CsgG/HfaB family protein [Candidatus Neomarinimicrobiota bacterium]
MITLIAKKRGSLLLLLTLLISVLPSTASAQGIAIAVLDFEGFGISRTDAIALTNRLRNELFRLGTFNVVERGMMESILAEQDFQLTGCTTDECLVEVGRLIGAQQMIGGSISKVGGTFTVSARRVDVESGIIIGVSDYDLQGALDDLLMRGMRMVAFRLAGLEGKEVIPTRPPVTQPGVEGVNDRLISAGTEKNPKTAFTLSLLIPGAGQWYIDDPTINTSAKGTRHLTLTVLAWALAATGNSTYREEKDNADYLFSIDPGGMDSTIYDESAERQKNAEEWREEADLSRSMITFFSALAIVSHAYSAVNARQLAKEYNAKRSRISFLVNPRNRGVRLVYYYTF